MGDARVWTAEELERLSPNERRDVVRAGFVKDLSRVSPDLVKRARGKARARSAESDETAPTEG
jgi:hypothetical protein